MVAAGGAQPGRPCLRSSAPGSTHLAVQLGDAAGESAQLASADRSAKLTVSAQLAAVACCRRKNPGNQRTRGVTTVCPPGGLLRRGPRPSRRGRWQPCDRASRPPLTAAVTGRTALDRTGTPAVTEVYRPRWIGTSGGRPPGGSGTRRSERGHRLVPLPVRQREMLACSRYRSPAGAPRHGAPLRCSSRSHRAPVYRSWTASRDRAGAVQGTLPGPRIARQGGARVVVTSVAPLTGARRTTPVSGTTSVTSTAVESHGTQSNGTDRGRWRCRSGTTR